MQEETMLERRVGELESTKRTEESVHSETITFLKKQRGQLVSDVAKWNQRFQEDLDAKDEELRVRQTLTLQQCAAPATQ